MTNAKAVIHAVRPNFSVTPKAFKELFDAYYNSLKVSMPFLFCMFSPFKKCSFLVKKILLIKQCIDSFLFFFHEFFPFF